MDSFKVGKFIAECRKSKNMTQAELAKKLNITDRAVSKWETGKGMPDSSLMLALCDALGISVNELLSGEKIAPCDYVVKAEENFLNLKRKVDRVVKAINIVSWIIFAITVALFFAHMYFNWVYRDSWDDSGFQVISYILIGISIVGNLITTALKYEAKE